MRNITDNKNNIYELQRYLRELHHDKRYNLPLVNPDGIYGDETRLAVEAFQRQDGLTQTGNVDYNTWKHIYDAYTKSIEKRTPGVALNVFPEQEGYIVKEGENSDLVTYIQLILRLLSNVYDTIEGVNTNGFYTPETIKDIKEFQKIHRLNVTGEVDKETWDELAKAFNRTVNIEN